MPRDCTHRPKARHPLLHRAAALLKRHLPAGTRHILVALSGGADSVALLHALLSLREALGVTLSAAHLNHNLRGEEALRDQQFVQQLCAQWGIALAVESLLVADLAREGGLSVETAGRNARYALFERVCAQLDREGRGPCVTATAHTLSDQAETVLLNLMRGAGIEGLAGIPPARAGVIRPLLDSGRAEVEDYCATNGLSFVTDSTNLQPMYARNHVRLELLPLMERHNPSLLEALGRQAALMREAAELLAELADSLPLLLEEADGEIALDRMLMLQQHPALARRALRRRVRAAFGLTLSYSQSAQLLALCEKPGNGFLHTLPGGVEAETSYERLMLRCGRGSCAPSPQGVSLRPGQNELCGFGRITVTAGPVQALKLEIKNNLQPVYTHLLKYDIINGMPIVRGCRTGERYTPAGRPSKTLKRMAIDAKIPAARRAFLPVVTTPGGEILSAWPFGPAQAFALHPEDAQGDFSALLLCYALDWDA